MIRSEDKRNLIYQEFDELNSKEWFSLKKEKILHGIDSLYFTVYIQEPYVNIEFLNKLEKLKSMVELEPFYVSEFDLHITNLTFMNYGFCFSKEDNFKIFISRKTISSSYPPVMVHLSAKLLWEVGEYEALKKAYDYVEKILSPYYHILNIKENRIDYAYHTNYMRNIESFVDVKKLNSMQVSRFNSAYLYLTLYGDDGTSIDTVCFGRRESNNLFIRIYNKTKEVIEKGYKAFFYPIWLENGLISKYDLYCYEYAYKRKSYIALTMGRLSFYSEYGSDKNIKLRCDGILSGYERMEYDDLVRFANEITPSPTQITNFEFETKRKFYQSMDESMEYLELVTETDIKALHRLYKLFDNRVLLHKLLTHDIFRLVDVNDKVHKRKREKNVLPFWKLMQNLKITSYSPNTMLIRKYNRNMNISLLVTRISNSMSSLSLQLNKDNVNDIYTDTLDYLTLLSENDTKKAFSYKCKRAELLKDSLETTRFFANERRFALLEKEAGIYIVE